MLQRDDSYWTPVRLRAVQLLFEGQLSKTRIAAELGINPGTLSTWLSDPEFQARLVDMRNRLVEELEGVAFVKKEQRIIALSKLASDARDEWDQHRYLVEQRPAPGGAIVNEKLNEGAANIHLKALNDIARELGERQTNVKLTGKVETQQSVVINLVDVPDTLRAKYLSTKIVDADSPPLLIEPNDDSPDEESDDE